MWQHREPDKRFTVVDIDPYGGADPFLDAAVQAVEDGGNCHARGINLLSRVVVCNVH